MSARRSVAPPWSDADTLSKLMRLRDDLAMRGDGSVAQGLALAMAGAESTTTARRVARAIEDAIDRIDELERDLDQMRRQRDEWRDQAEQMQAFLHRLDGGGTIVPYSAVSGPAYAIAKEAGRVFDTPDGRRLIYVPGPASEVP